MEDENRLIQERKKKLDEIRDLGIEPYPYSYEKTDSSSEINSKFSELKPEEHSKYKAKSAGRIVALRRMGKASFAHIQDQDGKLQLYLSQDNLGKEKYNFLKKIDIGDFIGVEGFVFKTRTGEITIEVKNFELLSKSLRPLPEKFHGLKDEELRYRQRYVDLIVNPEVKEVFLKRTKILKVMREFMEIKGFIEIETPLLQSIYGGALAKPFKTHCDAYNSEVYLSIAPELFLKKALVGGFDRVYEITKKFRNEGVDRQHNPEHMTIEWYQGYADYNDGMDLFEELMKMIATALFGKLTFEYQGNKIDLSKWERITLLDAIKKYLGEDISHIKTDEEAKEIAQKHGIEPEGITKANLADELMKLFREKLIQPTFLIDYPIELSPLAKPKRGDPSKAEVFQPFVGGMELGRAYSELNDPQLQAKHFQEQEDERKKGNMEAMETDKDFVVALEYGMPPACGVGVGIERVVMLFANQPSIKDVITFPFMKPETK